MEIVKIDNRSGSELHAANFVGRRARARVIPRPNNEKMFGALFGRRVRNVIAIVTHRAGLIAVVLTGDGQDRLRNLFELVGGGHHRIVIGVDRRMF